MTSYIQSKEKLRSHDVNEYSQKLRVKNHHENVDANEYNFNVK